MYFTIKRILDIVLAAFMIILFSPIMLSIACTIKIDTKGPALFKQGRLGKNGREFTIYKFRTMIENAENMGTGLFNYDDDFRVTKVGKFLRLTSLDELPQLFNIIKGDMSFIGPRPPVTYELGKYEELTEKQKKRFEVLPGVSGLSQINGRNELTWDEKIEFDIEYIELLKKRGFLIDVKILLLTIVKVLTMEGAYEIKEESNPNMNTNDNAMN